MTAGGRRLCLLVLLLLLAFSLRVHRIGDQRVWWDEGWSVWAARFPAADILRQTGNDVHPPLYFALLHAWRAGSGDSEAGLRLLSAYLGLLTVAGTFALGRSMARGLLPPGAAWRAGWLAALLLAVSRFAIAWSQEIRMYALATLLGVVAAWAARQLWAGGRRRDAAIFLLATVAGLYTLYLFGLVWAATNLAWMLGRIRPRSAQAKPGEGWWQWVSLQLAVLALFLPWAVYAAGGFLSTASATAIRLLDFLHIYWTVLTVGIPVDVAQFNWLTLPALGVFLGAVGALVVRARATTGRPLPRATGRTTVRRDLTLLFAILLLPIFIVYFISLPRQNFYNPPFNPRYLVIFTPFYSILLAWGVTAVGQYAHTPNGDGQLAHGRRRWAGVSFVLAAFMLAVALVGLWPYYPGRVRVDDYPSLVSTLAAYRHPDDSVVLYTDTDWPIFAFHHPRPWRGVPHLWAITPELAADFLAPIWESHDAVWLVTTPYSAASDPQRHLPAWLAERATAVRTFSYGDMVLTLYARTADRAAAAGAPAPDAPSPRPLDIPLSDGRMTGFTQATRDFESGDMIHLFLYYTATADSEVSVALLDDAGDVWGKTPVALPAAPEWGRQPVDLLVPPDAPSGRYRPTIITADGAMTPFSRLIIRQEATPVLTEADVSIAYRRDVSFAGGVQLLGYELSADAARPGEAIGLTLYWSASGPLTPGHKVFTHLLGETFNAAAGNFLWGQSDAEPAANTRPTTTWRAGEVIVDQHLIPIAAEAPPGTYTLEVGLYEPVSGMRLAVLGPDGTPAADHVILTNLAVAP